MQQPVIIETPSEKEFKEQAIEFTKDIIAHCTSERGLCVLGLSGGSTPGPVYEALAGDKDIDWQKIRVFLVDDRYVPAGHKDSNQKLLHDSLLSHIAIPQENICFPNTALSLEQCVDDYALRLGKLFTLHEPDLIILGMGDDGHTASLFPGGDASIKEQEKLVLHTTTDRFAVRDRITVTIPVLQSAGHQLLLLKGSEKKDVFKKMMSSGKDIVCWPVQSLRNLTVIVF